MVALSWESGVFACNTTGTPLITSLTAEYGDHIYTITPSVRTPGRFELSVDTWMFADFDSIDDATAIAELVADVYLSE